MPFLAINSAIIYFDKCVNSLLQHLKIKRVSQNIPVCNNSQRIETKNRFPIFILHCFPCITSHRDKGLKFSVEPFCQPCITYVWTNSLPVYIPDVSTCIQKIEFLFFVPQVIGAIVEDTRRNRASLVCCGMVDRLSGLYK